MLHMAWAKEGLKNERAHSPKLSVASPTSQLILQPFHRFTYVTVHSATLPLLHLRHSSFSNPSVASSTKQLILQPFRCFTYVTAHSITLPSLHLRHSSFCNPSVASPTSPQSPTLLSLILCHRLFTYVSWRAVHGIWLRDHIKIMYNKNKRRYCISGVQSDFSHQKLIYLLTIINNSPNFKSQYFKLSNQN